MGINNIKGLPTTVKSICRLIPSISISLSISLNLALPNIPFDLPNLDLPQSPSPLNLAANPQFKTLATYAFNSLPKIQQDPNNYCKKPSSVPNIWNLQFVFQNSSSVQVHLDSILVFLSWRFLILLSSWLI